MIIKQTTTNTSEIFDHISGEKSTAIEKIWKVEHDNLLYTRTLSKYGVTWDNPNVSLSSVSQVWMSQGLSNVTATKKTHQNKTLLSSDVLENLFISMMREKKLEKIT